MNKIELQRRTKEFSLQLIHFLESLPKNYLGEALGRQLLKSGTSIGANQEAIRLMQEAKQLLAIFTAAGRTSKGRR
jgi:four helix bundle protein